jgi:hypothetical protein
VQCNKTFVKQHFKIVDNKPVSISSKPFQLRIMFEVMLNPNVELMKGASIEKALASLTNILLSWKGLAGTNTHNVFHVCPWQALSMKSYVCG